MSAIQRWRGVVAVGGILAAVCAAAPAQAAPGDPKTPIKHLVVIFDENVSFDHYFATYPEALNPAGEPKFTPLPGTQRPDNLVKANLLGPNNPNSQQPARMGHEKPYTCSQDHSYTDEQKAWNNGLMDKFVEFGSGCRPSVVVNYYDGNTVTALWNYANNFAMSDAFHGTTFGPSTPGAINLISGNTHGTTHPDLPGEIISGTLIGDPDPEVDDCGRGGVTLSGKNIGDRMNAAHMTWGWFEGGFRPTAVTNGKATCGSTHTNGVITIGDYIAHHQPFQYYASTRNPHHLKPSSPKRVGKKDRANHQYDLLDFDAAIAAGNLPQVSFLKAAAYQDGHAGYSGPLDEQAFVVKYVNKIAKSKFWKSTAIIITYDDSDGWYDHQHVAPVNSSSTAADSNCAGPRKLGGFEGRCGHGPRLPFIVVSPYARRNHIDHTPLDQTSVLKFIEKNWGVKGIGPESFDSIANNITGLLDFRKSAKRSPKLILDPANGTPAR